jgi:FHA domain-containing protein
MREIHSFAGNVIVAYQAQPFYKNPYSITVASPVSNPIVIAVAALVVAAIILVAALLLFRNSGKKKKANAAASSDWQRQGQQPPPAGWNQPGTAMPAPNPWGQQGQQPNVWGAQQQPGGWDAQNPAQQQPPGWGAQSPAPQQQAPGWGAQSPAPQQPAAWDMQSPAQQQAPGWGAQTPPPQQPAAWGNQSSGSVGGQQPWDVPASPDPWAQPQQGASPWNQQSNQPAPTTYGSGSGSGQSWAQPAQVADQWGQPAQQGGWSPGLQQPPASTPAGANAQWQQQGQGQGQQGFGATPFESPDSDRTMLRSTGGSQGIGIVRIEEGKEPGRIYEVRKESLSIGRSRESDIFLEDLAVSRLHASIVSIGNNNYALRDEGSANGTKVNGQSVNKYQPYPLQEGDKIQLGQTVLVFARR